MINFAKFIFVFILFSTSTFASFSFPKVNWKNLSEDDRASVLIAVHDYMSELEKISPEEVACLNYHLIEEAYAAGFDCFIAGWPSSKNAQGRCQSPVSHNSSYKNYFGCREGEMLCNPALFGDKLCISFKTQAQKNSAFDQCEKAYQEDGRLFSEVLDGVSAEEFDELISTVYQSCHVKKDMGASCQKLKRKLQHFVPDETPQNYANAQAKLKDSDPEKVLKAAQKLQSEMEKDYYEFKRVCEPSISSEKAIYCKNLALRVKKSNEILPKLFTAVETKVGSSDCVNCSSHVQKTVLNSDSMPDLGESQKLTCTEEQKTINKQKCGKDIACAIGSSALSSLLLVQEALGKKPKANACLSSQNDCVTNFVSAMIDSLVSLVTGIADLLGMALKWTGEKLSDFWDRVTGVEDATATAQHLLNKMSDADKKEVKTNPIQWVTNLAKGIWEGITIWLKEDIFCEQWAGIPRASACLQPATSYDCLSCRTALMGVCSAGGVIAAEVLPAFLTGGAVNVAGKAGKTANAFAKFVKASKSYKKVASAVDKLSDIRAIRLATQGVKKTGLVIKTGVKPVAHVTKASFQKVSSGYKAMVGTKGFQLTSKALDKAAKYSGLKYTNKVMDEAYKLGYKVVDDIAGEAEKSRTVYVRLKAAQAFTDDKAALTAPYYKKVQDAYKVGFEIDGFEQEIRAINLDTKLSEVDKAEKIKVLNNSIAEKRLVLKEMNKEYIEGLYEIYKKEGIPVQIVKNDKFLRLELDFTREPTTRSGFEFYKRAKNRFGLDKITINLEDTAGSRANGYFVEGAKRVEAGPNQGLQLLDDYINTTGKHELRHSMFFAKRNRGDDSLFHLQFHASKDGKHLLNDQNFYSSFMSAEELYTFSTDLQSFGQVLKGEFVTDLNKQKGLISQISSKNKGLQTVATTNKQLADSMIESIDESVKVANFESLLIYQRPNGVLVLEIPDKTGRVAVMSFVSSEEKSLLMVPHNLKAEFTKRQEQFLISELQKQGIDHNQLLTQIKTGSVTSDELLRIQAIAKSYESTAEAIDLNQKYNQFLIPAMNKTKKKFEDLRKLSEIQLKESKALDPLIAEVEKTGKYADIDNLRTKLFETAKNVKEDYKGFALAGQTP